MAIEKLISLVSKTSNPVGKSERDRGQPPQKKEGYLIKKRNSNSMMMKIFSRRMKDNNKARIIKEIGNLL